MILDKNWGMMMLYLSCAHLDVNFLAKRSATTRLLRQLQILSTKNIAALKRESQNKKQKTKQKKKQKQKKKNNNFWVPWYPPLCNFNT